MIDFAKYAFNKSHAAAYAVVSYQTAWLKYYYPVEFMAALMTSVIENPGKVSEYIYTCRQMGIEILPPDINKGEGSFSVDNGNIRRISSNVSLEKRSTSVRSKVLSSQAHLTAWVGPGSSLWSSTCRFWIRLTRKGNIP